MIQRPADLADYERPPVDEVVIGVALWPTGIGWDQVGEYWQQVRDAYPNVQYMARLPIVREVLTGQPGEISFTPWSPFVFAAPQSPIPAPVSPNQRTWLITPDDVYVIQIQDDAFLHNWRRRGEESYPHFESLYEKFWELFPAFRALLEVHGIGVSIQQVEITYVNWISDKTVADNFSPGRLAKITLPESSERLLIDSDSLPEMQMWNGSYRIYRSKNPVARLRVETADAFRFVPPPGRGQQMTLTFKAPVAPGTSDEMVQELMGMGRDVIVSAFTSLSTREAQTSWGRFQ